MLARLLVAFTLAVSPVAAQTPDLTCEAELFGANRNKITCVDPSGAIARATGAQMQHLYMQQALRQFDCPVPVLDGVSEPSQEAVDCFHEKFGRPGPLTDAERRALEAAGVFSTEEMMTRALTSRRIKAAEDIDPGITFAKTIDHPDGALFIHPASQESWMGGGIELLGWTSSRRSSEGAVQIRWADPQAFDGRTLAAFEGDAPRFLVEFGTQGATVSTPEAPDGEWTAYETRTGFTCVPDPGEFTGECLGITLQRPDLPAEPWRNSSGNSHHGQGHHATPAIRRLRRRTRGWDAAVATLGADRAETQASLDGGAELDALPLDGIANSAARIIARTYDAPARFNDEMLTAQRLPFIAYHRAYAQTCADAFDGPSRPYQVIAYGLEDFSYVPFQKYEVWGSYVADEFAVQSDYFDAFATGMAEFPAASFKDWTAPLGGPDIEFVDMMILSEREFAGWVRSFATLIERIGCAGPTTDRLERNLLAAFELRRSV